MLMLRRHGKTAGAALVLGAVLTAHATDSKYQTFIIGDRAAGMGGAVVSLADSLEACYYNPAGLVRASASSISLSANLYGFQRYRVESGIYPGEDLDSDSFLTIPVAMGAVLKPFPNLALAVAALVPDQEHLSEIVAHRGGRHLNQYSYDNRAFWVGPSAAYLLAPSCSIGLSLFAIYRSFEEHVSLYYDDQNQAYARTRSFDDVALAVVLGIQQHFDGGWRVGLTVQSPTVHVYDQGKTTEHVAGRAVQGINYYFTEDVETENRLPAKITLGAGRMVPQLYAFGMDLTWHLPLTYDLQTWEAVGETQRAKVVRSTVVDVNLGVEYYLWKQYPLRGGFFTGFSSVPGLDDADLYSTSRVDTFGLTFSIGRETKTTAFNIGIAYIFGSGTDAGWAVQGGQLVRRETDASEQHLYLTVNTAYYF